MPGLLQRGSVLMLNPRTCGVLKSGTPLYKITADGQRTADIDNELIEHVEAVIQGVMPPGAVRVPLSDCVGHQNFTPRYYDPRWGEDFNHLIASHGVAAVTLGELEAQGAISVADGHGSPGKDLRVGDIPYIKVSDIRHLRVNVNPTNLIPRALAQRFWRGPESGLQGWDLITPNRASSNIGEFAMLLPGEEEVVLTREVFVIRSLHPDSEWDPHYLLWALSLRAVRRQWSRVTLMQTNREDVGERYKEVAVPVPKDIQWARDVSAPFRAYFTTLSEAKKTFGEAVTASAFDYIPSVRGVSEPAEAAAEEVAEAMELSAAEPE